LSGFSRLWLRMREAADHRARHSFAAELNALACRRWQIIDLGCGTGSNLRFLAPLLDAPQRWICVDNDAELLEALTDTGSVRDQYELSTRCADLAEDVESTIAAAAKDSPDSACTLVTASALLDLVSATFIDALVAACVQAHAGAMFALNYDGRVALTPSERHDNELCALINEHQLGDKGFGPALGPGAAIYARKAFERAGFTVHDFTSDWQLDASDRELQQALLEGWLDAAREQAVDPGLLSDWARRRFEQIAAGELGVRVGHRDLLALPETLPRN
jgi:SAM-dependent methyltransferase